jgi:hypothetical protein
MNVDPCEGADGRDCPSPEVFDRIMEALREEGLKLSEPAVKAKVMELALLMAGEESASPGAPS